MGLLLEPERFIQPVWDFVCVKNQLNTMCSTKALELIDSSKYIML